MDYKVVKTNQKGQGSMMSFFTIVMGLILMAALLPVVNSVVGVLVDNTDMSNLAQADIIRLLLGMVGVIMVILFLMSIISDFQQRQQYV
jgi:uncharacterized BrkB/YihY/UPF0761 family membrane protein